MKQLAITLIILTIGILTANAQQTDNTPERKGFMFGLGISGGAISISDEVTGADFEEGQGGISLPNIKIGYMINSKLAVLLNTQGLIYEYNNYDRSFETALVSVQYWVKDRWWIGGGFGAGIDMPALYDVEDNFNDDFNFGCAAGISTGYEIFQRKHFTIDLQLQATAGRAFLENNLHRDAATFTAGIGFNIF